MLGSSKLSNLSRKALTSFRSEGPTATAQRIAGYLRTRIITSSPQYRKKRAEIFKLTSAEDRFTEIYKSNYWLGGESASGPGSSIRYTSEFQSEFQRVISELSIRSVFDGPCGDFHWMKHVLPAVNIRYIGGDIVAPLIDDLSSKYASPSISFVHLDLTRGPFPKADLMLCRDCLFHLSYRDTELVLRTFLSSGIPYLFTSNHENRGEIVNRDIETGDFRRIDLFAAPYHFPSDPIYTMRDAVSSDPDKKMCMWSRDQVAIAVQKMGEYNHDSH